MVAMSLPVFAHSKLPLGVCFMAIVGIIILGCYGRRRYYFRTSAPHCTYCGYDLTGLPDDHRCPECGEVFSLAECLVYQKDPIGYRRAKEREEWIKSK